jgi:4-hydroxy-3-methylbut-2-en-1-yl diphosphate synthase IspG/GcpE
MTLPCYYCDEDIECKPWETEIIVCPHCGRQNVMESEYMDTTEASWLFSLVPPVDP